MYQPFNFMQPMQPGINPYAMQPAAPQMQVTKVNGANGAQAFAMGPNSSAILLDAGGTMIWAVTTDGAGYKTVTPYDIKPHQEAPALDYGSLEGRIKRLEEIVNGNSADTAADRKIQPGNGAD